MNVEHSDCLSWFSRECESHKQDGETLLAQLCCNACSASRDPAMAFGSSLDMNGQMAHSTNRQLRCRAKADAFRVPPTDAREIPRANLLTANTQPFDQLLVTPIVRAPQVIENLAWLRDGLQQAPPRMVVFVVGLEVIRQVVDPLGEERNLDLGRTRVAGLSGVRLNDFRLTRGRYRHRQQPFFVCRLDQRCRLN